MAPLYRKNILLTPFAPLKWFMRLTGDGVGMHVGILPGYPASHGCIRMPPQAAEMFYARVKLGTPVEVTP